ncbi:uncharacterized protein FOMMEDRAFT_154152 [Fomitiporia mediterranea MF3/22]|uniref:uncharacterized protein n=1 Tax=Fomitiporia mediterranea (strain MF3/22) TaxID=694068 RepID=UPI0004409102|nr:uncharacterized protein FOMMEDRAFT_154152 [Fomitiporia mediterranea MF3/22]EJD04994.1 hypothetical protein FOMMEDRAFT_154152 [Fomitiporia mediterranea MF3/22]
MLVVGSVNMLSLLGSRMLLRLKEAAGERLDRDASFRISANLSIAEFRAYTTACPGLIEDEEHLEDVNVPNM